MAIETLPSDDPSLGGLPSRIGLPCRGGKIDAENRFLWRFSPRRLSAEEIRDSMLAAAGVLNRRMGGPGFRLYRYLQDNVATYVPLDQHGSETWREPFIITMHEPR